MLMGKKEVLYESHKKQEFKTLKEALKKEGIKASAGSTQTECTSGCGAKINVHKAMNRDFDPYVYYIYVKEEDLAKAREIMAGLQIETDDAPYRKGLL